MEVQGPAAAAPPGSGSGGASLLVFRDPQGRVIPPRGARPGVVPDATALVREWAGKPIDAETGACGWDGLPVDYASWSNPGAVEAAASPAVAGAALPAAPSGGPPAAGSNAR